GCVMELLSLTQDELGDALEALGEPRYRARQLCSWVYARRAADFESMSDLPAALRTKLAEEFSLRPLEQVSVTGAKDTTQKFLFRLQDGQLIETVLIPASIGYDGERSKRRTLCVSSQVGCAYGCKFCASGLDGWKRHL